MYTLTNFKTKKELKESIARGDKIGFFQPGPFGGSEPREGNITLEGPHYPAAHTWYATARVQEGYIVSVK